MKTMYYMEVIFQSKDDAPFAQIKLHYAFHFSNPNKGKPTLPKDFENVNLPNWPRHTPNGEEYLKMQSLNKMVVKTKLREKYCDFWNTPMYALYRSTYF